MGGGNVQPELHVVNCKMHFTLVRRAEKLDIYLPSVGLEAQLCEI